MKKLFLFAFIILLHLQSSAAWKDGMIRLRHEMGRSISITIDGRKFNKIGRFITVGDVNPGIHQIKIYKYNSNGYGYATGTLIYQGRITVRPGRIYYATVSNTGLAIEENCCIDDYGHWNNNDNWENENDDNSTMNDREENWNNNNQWNHDNHDDPNTNDNSKRDNNSWGSYKGQMSEGRLNDLILQIRKASFETSKESVAKQAIRSNKVTCKQLLQIINEFSFESTKLQVAKDAYKSVLDRNNYYLLNDAFTFQSSKDDLIDFLDKSGR